MELLTASALLTALLPEAEAGREALTAARVPVSALRVESCSTAAAAEPREEEAEAEPAAAAAAAPAAATAVLMAVATAEETRPEGGRASVLPRASPRAAAQLSATVAMLLQRASCWLAAAAAAAAEPPPPPPPAELLPLLLATAAATELAMPLSTARAAAGLASCCCPAVASMLLTALWAALSTCALLAPGPRPPRAALLLKGAMGTLRVAAPTPPSSSRARATSQAGLPGLRKTMGAAALPLPVPAPEPALEPGRGRTPHRASPGRLLKGEPPSRACALPMSCQGTGRAATRLLPPPPPPPPSSAEAAAGARSCSWPRPSCSSRLLLPALRVRLGGAGAA